MRSNQSSRQGMGFSAAEPYTFESWLDLVCVYTYVYIHMIHMCVKSSPSYAIFESGISQRFLKLRFESCNSVRYFSWKKSGSYQLILLMVQKSCDHQLRLAVYPIIYTVLAPSQVVSRISEPSTVWKIPVFRLGFSSQINLPDFFHQQYL